MKVGQDPFLGQMQRALDVMSKRQQIVASNVGNVDTPRYRAVDMDFNKELARAVEKAPGASSMRRTSPLHLGGSRGGSRGGSDPELLDVATPARSDGNNVNIEREMMALAETRGRYGVATSLARLRLRQMVHALSSGGGS